MGFESRVHGILCQDARAHHNGRVGSVGTTRNGSDYDGPMAQGEVVTHVVTDGAFVLVVLRLGHAFAI